MELWYTKVIQAVAFLIVGVLATLISSKFLKIILEKIASKTKSKTDDFIVEVLIGTIKPIGYIFTITVAWLLMPFEAFINTIFLAIIKLTTIFILVRSINKIVMRLLNRWSEKINDRAISTMAKSLRPLVRAGIWSLGVIVYLQNIGVQMAAIWALLSAGGIGAGLALKEPVQEFFEYVTILLDKPFQSGEFINTGGVWATVERVGVRSTRLRSLNGEIIVMSNSSLTNGIIANYAEMQSRRLVHKLSVVYETPVDKMKKIPLIIENIVNSTSDVKFDRCHFTEFAESSLDFELVYYIPNNNYVKAMDAQQKINLEIMNTFANENIDFAFPTRTINLIDQKNS